MSLRQQLNDLIKERGQISYQEIKGLVESGAFGKKYRISNMERRLRESPEVEAVIENGYITSYRWKGQRPIGYRTLIHEGQVVKRIPIYQ